MIILVCLEDGSARKVDDEDILEWDESYLHLKIEGDKLFEMEEGGDWKEVK